MKIDITLNTVQKLQTILKLGYRVNFQEKEKGSWYRLVIYKGLSEVYCQSRERVDYLVDGAYNYILSINTTEGKNS